MAERELTTACQLLMMTLVVLFSQCPLGRASCNEESQLARFKNAATLTIPGEDISALSIVTGQSVQLQCQSQCGSLRWLLDGGNINNEQENTHQTVYMANCQGQSECRDRNFIFCDENQSLIDLGPLTSNLTIAFSSPGVHVLQCEGTLQGQTYGALGRFYYHSRVVLIKVMKNKTEGEDLASTTTEPSNTETIEPSATATRGGRASSADAIISEPLPSFSDIQKTPTICIPSITTVTHCPLNTNLIMASTTPAVSTTVTTTHSFLSSCPVTITTTESSAVSSCSTTGSGINVVGDRLINKDPTSLAMTGTIGLLLILTVIGWVACLIATCKIKRTKGGRGVYRVHNFPIINQDDNGTIKSTTCETRRTLAQPNRYTTVHLRSSHESIRSMHKSQTPPALLQTPPSESVLRQGSVEAYTVNVNKEREPIQKRESLL